MAVSIQNPRGLQFLEAEGAVGPFFPLHTHLRQFYGSLLGPVVQAGVGILVEREQQLTLAERTASRIRRREGWAEGDSVLVVLETADTFQVLAELPTAPRFWYHNPDEKAWIAARPPLFPRTLVTGGPGVIAAIETGTGLVRVWEINGEHSRWTADMEFSFPFTEAARRGYAEAWVREGPRSQGVDREKILSLAGAPSTYSAIDVLFVDRLQRVWIRYLPQTPSEPARWVAFDLSGTVLCEMRLPLGEVLVDLSADLSLTQEKIQTGSKLRSYRFTGCRVRSPS